MEKGKKRLKSVITVIISVILLVAVCCTILVACASGGNSENPNGASSTNNQTAGIDESDIVKVTSDGYIFKAQSDGVSVSKATDGFIELVKKESYSSFTPCEMFVTANNLIIIGNKKVPIEGTSATMTKSEVKIYSLDALKNGGAEYYIRNSEYFGTFYTARIYNDRMYVVLNISYTNNFGDTPINYMYDSYQGLKKFDIIDDLANEKNENKIYAKGMIIVKYELNEVATKPITAKFYAGEDISDLYCSPYAIYTISWYTILKEGSGGGCGYSPSYRQNGTKISKISLDDLSLKGEILTTGNILNRYSLYDNGLIFYVVSTVGSSTMVSSYDRDLKIIANSETFAYNERVYSVRYEEDICYVVTFRQTDPLFKIDISNPMDIKILGALKIDGYSTHLQAFGDGYLMGLGYETDIRATPTGIKLTLFGVEDDMPTEIKSILFSNAYGQDTKSEATKNPKAILCEPDNNIFAFPLQYKKEGKLYQGAVVYGIVDGELTELAFLTNYETGVSALDTEKNIIRIVRIGDFLYTIADKHITSYSLSDFTLIDTLET